MSELPAPSMKSQEKTARAVLNFLKDARAPSKRSLSNIIDGFGGRFSDEQVYKALQFLEADKLVRVEKCNAVGSGIRDVWFSYVSSHNSKQKGVVL